MRETKSRLFEGRGEGGLIQATSVEDNDAALYEIFNTGISCVIISARRVLKEE